MRMKDKKLPFTPQTVYYANYIKSYGKVLDCIVCHQCEKSCPQHIKIVDMLKRLQELLKFSFDKNEFCGNLVQIYEMFAIYG